MNSCHARMLSRRSRLRTAVEHASISVGSTVTAKCKLFFVEGGERGVCVKANLLGGAVDEYVIQWEEGETAFYTCEEAKEYPVN